MKLIFLGFLVISLSGCYEFTPEHGVRAQAYCHKFGMVTVVERSVWRYDYPVTGFFCKSADGVRYRIPAEDLYK